MLWPLDPTRPDIAQAVGAVSKFCAQPTEAHFTAAKRVLCYLSGTKDLALRYQKSSQVPMGYSMLIGQEI